MKHMATITSAAFCTIALGACQPSDRSDQKIATAPSATAPSATASSDMEEEIADAPTLAQANRSVAEDGAPDAAPDTIPLTPGVYVVEGTSCENPANAAWRVWDGEGLSGSTTRTCRAEVLSRSGNTYRLRNSCENTYDGSRTDETLAITVTDQVHFTTESVAFASCSTAQVPAALRRRLTGEGGY